MGGTDGAAPPGDAELASPVVAAPDEAPTVAGHPAARRPGDPEGTLSVDHGDLPDLGSWRGGDGGRYLLGREIARGGGGRVLAARDLRLGHDVAVKLPLEEPGSLERLVREAQLMSRLEHPAIVAVHDLARADDGTPFYVMKLLDGETLRARIAGKPFEDRIALLPTLIAICDAVAYAHHRGILHRDLKPGNVIVGEFGATSVIDWGLARALGSAPEAARSAPSPASPELTEAGAVVGTPAYMAPEQARGDAVDVRADVYGLGALLYHVLGGDAPYRAADSRQVLAGVLEGPPPPVTELEPRLPRELAAIVAKAMARRPDDRYDDAGQLAADLRRYQAGRLVAAHRYSPWQRLRRWMIRHRIALGAGTVAAAAAAAVVIAWPARGLDARAMCAATDDVVAAAWSPATRREVLDRVRASGGPGAPVAADAIGARLDGYAGRLGAARIEACEATHVRGEQSAELLDLRMQCLDRRVGDLTAAVGLFERVGPDEVDAMRTAVETIPSLDDCADADQLRSLHPLPADEATRASVVALQARSSEAFARSHAGRFASALELVRELRADPAVASYPPLAVELRYLEGDTLHQLGKYAESEVALRETIDLADRARVDRYRASATYQLAVTLRDQERFDEASAVLDRLDALVERLGDRQLEVYRLTLAAQIADGRGRLPEALALAEEAVRRWEAQGGAAWALADLIGNVGGRLVNMSRYADAEPHVRRALELHERELGPDHPTVARSLVNLAAILQSTGRVEDALRTYDRALAILDRAGLGEQLDVLHILNNMPVALTGLGRFDEAREKLRRALAIGEAKLGPDHSFVGRVLYNLGNNELERHDSTAAEAWMRKSLAHREQHLGAKHLSTANTRWGLAAALLDQGRPREALPLLLAALPVQIAESGPDTEDVAFTQRSIARAHLALGRPTEALGPATECQAFFAAYHDPRERGAARMLLARVHHALGRDRAKAIELAELARADFVEAKADAGLAELDQLLAELRSGSP